MEVPPSGYPAHCFTTALSGNVPLLFPENLSPMVHDVTRRMDLRDGRLGVRGGPWCMMLAGESQAGGDFACVVGYASGVRALGAQ